MSTAASTILSSQQGNDEPRHAQMRRQTHRSLLSTKRRWLCVRLFSLQKNQITQNASIVHSAHQARVTRGIFDLSSKQDRPRIAVGGAEAFDTGLLAACALPYFLRARRARGSSTAFSVVLLRCSVSVSHDFSSCWNIKDTARRVLAVAF